MDEYVDSIKTRCSNVVKKNVLKRTSHISIKKNRRVKKTIGSSKNRKEKRKYEKDDSDEINE